MQAIPFTSGQRLLVEIKARCDSHRRIRSVLRDHDARFVGEDHQVDTYFDVPKGRLKLREGTIEQALIYYEREDTTGPKESKVLLYEVEPNEDLKTLLSEAFGVRVVVDKWREIYFIDNVKIHLDRVGGIGRFVEIEAIDRDGSVGSDRLREQCQFFIEAFGITDKSLCSGSYADMLYDD